MKIIRALVLTTLSVAAALAADVAPSFNATLTVGKESRFVLIGTDGKASPWLSLGDTFDGYKLKGYDAKASALDLEKDGKVTRVALATDAAVGAGKLAATPATLADAEGVLKKMHIDELLDRTVEMQTRMVNAQFDRQSKQMVAQGISQEDATAFRDKIVAEVKSLLDPAQLKDDLTKIYSEVFSKDELDGMAAFYSTPLGEAVSKKQADVQEKIGAVVQQRMVQTMPKIQQLTQQFAAEQRAKRAAAATAAPAAPAAVPAPAPAPAPLPAPKP